MSDAARVRSWFWFLLILNILFIVGTRYYIAPLTSGEIVRFETAKHLVKASAIIDDWTASGKIEKAKQSIWIDYIFILLYVLGLMAAAMFISDITRYPLLVRSGRFFRWLLPAAGICDMFENIFMQRSLNTGPTHLSVMLAYDMAMAKFSILIVTFLFLIICLLFWLLRKLFPAVA
jgi:hypothetical protein